jgi:glutamate dehydrogenase
MAAAKASKPNASKSSVQIEPSLLKAMTQAFTVSALPGENDGFDSKACKDAARFTLELALQRKSGKPAAALDSFTDAAGRLAMRIAMNNDDMPFLVDSISAAIAAKGIGVKRLIHPVLNALRDDDGVLKSVRREIASLLSIWKPTVSTPKSAAI